MMNGPTARRYALLWQALALALLILPLPAARAAVSEELILATGIGANREEARANALVYAKQAGVARVARRLDAAKARSYLPALTPSEVEGMIRGLTVVDEKRDDASGAYYARVKVSVMDGPIRRAFGIEEVAPAAQDAGKKSLRPILVVPVFYDGKTTSVWDAKTNPGFALWRDKAVELARGGLHIPSGDPRERAIVDRDNAMSVTFEEIKPLAESYGCAEAAIVILADAKVTDQRDQADIVIRRLSAAGEKLERLSVSPDEQTRQRPALFAKAVGTAAELLTRAASATSGAERDALAKATRLRLTVHFTTLGSWSRVQQALRETEGVLAMEAVALTLHRADTTLYLADTPETIAARLAAKGMRMERVGQEGAWELRVR